MKLEIYNRVYYLKDYDKFSVTDSLIEDYERQYQKKIMDILNCFLNDNLSIVFCILEQNLDAYEEERSFIEERTICVNDEWIFNYPKPNGESPLVRWFKPIGKLELLRVLKYDMLFTCIILNKELDIDSGLYIISCEEEWEYNELFIKELKNGDFLDNVLPKVELSLGESLEIVDMRR